MVSTDQEQLPEWVTFETGAKLLCDLEIYPDATGDTIRYVARTRGNWPFGDGRLPYGKVSNARTMDAKVFVAYFRKNPPTGRGPDRKPRARKKSRR